MSDAGWALVTGAARRIGKALALAAAQAGYDVIVHHRASAQAASQTAREVESLGRRAQVAELDFNGSDPAELLSAAPGAVTLLVNCASTFCEDDIETLDRDALAGAMTVNLIAPVLLAQAFARALPGHRSGLIVNIIDQRVWRLTPQFFSYTLAKAALWTATQTLAQALAPRIRVNAIGPGPTLASVHQGLGQFEAEVAAIPLGQGPTPDQIGKALAYLIDAPSVTGQMIAVDGGQHLAWQTPDIVG